MIDPQMYGRPVMDIGDLTRDELERAFRQTEMRLHLAEDAVTDLQMEVQLLNRAFNEASGKMLDAEKVRDASYDEIHRLDQRINEQDREIERLSTWALRACTFIQAAACRCGAADECDAHSLIFEYPQFMTVSDPSDG